MLIEADGHALSLLRSFLKDLVGTMYMLISRLSAITYALTNYIDYHYRFHLIFAYFVFSRFCYFKHVKHRHYRCAKRALLS